MKDKDKPSLSFIYQKQGLSGLLRELDVWAEKNAFLKWILDLDKKHFVFYKFLKDIVRLEKGIKDHGPQKQSLIFLTKLKIKTFTYTDISNKNFQNQRGLLIYGVNHNAFIEPIILFSLLRQQKIKLILYNLFFFIGKNIQKFSLPVVARMYSTDKGVSGLTKIFDPFFRLRNIENLTNEKVVKMNEETLKKAIKTLEEGGIVIIFPAGRGLLNRWGTGLSKIILSVSPKKREKISLLPVYFSGMGGKRMLLRIFKAYKGICQENLRVGVYFGKERTISEVYNLLKGEISERKLLSYLRKDAFSQYGLKEFPFKAYLHPKNYPLALARSSAFLVKIFFQLIPFKDLFKAWWSQ